MALVKYNNNSISNVTALASLPSGAMTHIKTITASSDSTISFVNGSSDVVLDSTYPIYLFKCINVHPSSSDEFAFNGSDDTSSHSYNITKTTTHYYAIHAENGTQGNLSYNSSEDLAQSTGFQNLTSASQIGTDNDCVTNGELYLFNPSSTTFVKHFVCDTHFRQKSDATQRNQNAGYFNTTSAINAIQFKMSNGEIQSGTIDLFGVV